MFYVNKHNIFKIYIKPYEKKTKHSEVSNVKIAVNSALLYAVVT